MAKKVNCVLVSNIDKNTDKGGAWLAKVTIQEGDDVNYIQSKAWSNASAAKRWVKAIVLEETPKKSIKWVAGTAVDEKGKAVGYTGLLNFKKDLI